MKEHMTESMINTQLMKEQEEVRKENKKADNKALLPLIIMVIVSAIIGGIFGFYSLSIKEKGASVIPETVHNVIAASALWVLALTLIVTVIAGMFQFYRYRKRYRQGLQSLEEDALLKLQDEIEVKLNKPLIALNAMMLIGFFEVAVLLIDSDYYSAPGLLTGMVEFSVLMILIFLLQQKMINFEKEINPEKKGSVFATDFQKTWFNSCDEAERIAIYEASYFSFHVMGNMYLVLWILLTFGAIAFDWGFLPVAIVMILWATQVFSYIYMAIKKEKERM